MSFMDKDGNVIFERNLKKGIRNDKVRDLLTDFWLTAGIEQRD